MYLITGKIQRSTIQHDKWTVSDMKKSETNSDTCRLYDSCFTADSDTNTFDSSGISGDEKLWKELDSPSDICKKRKIYNSNQLLCFCVFMPVVDIRAIYVFLNYFSWASWGQLQRLKMGNGERQMEKMCFLIADLHGKF